jgi:hypothetical protein
MRVQGENEEDLQGGRSWEKKGREIRMEWDLQ